MVRARPALDPVVDMLRRGFSDEDIRRDLKVQGKKAARISQLLREARDVVRGADSPAAAAAAPGGTLRRPAAAPTTAAATCPPATAPTTAAATSSAAAAASASDQDEPLDAELEEELIAAFAEELRGDRSEVEDSEDSDRSRTPVRSPPAAGHDALPPDIATRMSSLDEDTSEDAADAAELGIYDDSSEDEAAREDYLRDLGVDARPTRNNLNELIDGIGLGETAASGTRAPRRVDGASENAVFS